MSSKMAFIIGAILGEDWATGPQGEESTGATFQITSDGFVVCGDMLIGTADEFEDNLVRLEQAAKLNEEQRKLFSELKDAVITSTY